MADDPPPDTYYCYFGPQLSFPSNYSVLFLDGLKVGAAWGLSEHRQSNCQYLRGTGSASCYSALSLTETGRSI